MMSTESLWTTNIQTARSKGNFPDIKLPCLVIHNLANIITRLDDLIEILENGFAEVDRS